MNENIVKIRASVMRSIREFYEEESLTEVAPPVLTSFSCENACIGGSDLISVNYYDRKAYLSQSAQIYLEAISLQYGNVYAVNPAFRAESSALEKYLSEFWMCEAEMLNLDLNELRDHITRLIIHVLDTVVKKNSQELIRLGSDVEKFKRIISGGIPSVTYSQALAILADMGYPHQWGDEIDDSCEVMLGRSFQDIPFFVTDFPAELSSYYKLKDANGLTTHSLDLYAPNGFGELVGGSLREYKKDRLKASLIENGVPLEPFLWFLEVLDKRAVPHGGYGIGIERLLSWICNCHTIGETAFFPRTESILTP